MVGLPQREETGVVEMGRFIGVPFVCVQKVPRMSGPIPSLVGKKIRNYLKLLSFYYCVR